MRSRNRIAAVALSVLLVLSVVGPALAVAQTDDETATSDGSLQFDVEQGANATLVITVSDDNGTVEGSTVTVEAVDDGDEADDDEAESDDETENESETETEGDDEETENESESETETEGDDEETENESESETETEDDGDDEETENESETETETEDDADDEETESDNETEDKKSDNETDDDESSYAGAGTYTTDENGTVTVPAPDSSVELQITVEDGDRSTTSTVRANPGVGVPLGQQVQAFVQDLLSSDSDESIGQQIAAFVRSHTGPEHAGPPEDRGPDNETERGPPEDRGTDNETDRGPPEDAGNGGNGTGNGNGNGNGNGGGPPQDDGGTATETASG